MERAMHDRKRPAAVAERAFHIGNIQRAVARHYNVNREDLLSPCRKANVARPRHVAMYLARTLTLGSLPEIARCFGGRDHTTVLHAVRKIGKLVRNDRNLAGEISAFCLDARIGQEPTGERTNTGGA